MYNYLTSKQLKPSGWMLEQLKIQADGLAGKLDLVWPDVRNSAWIGGGCESWERVPYWLDGFIPLAYLLDDEDMIKRAKKYVDAILERQSADGWICPCDPEQRSSYDMWALMLMSKVLVLYFECSDDERVPPALYRAIKNFNDLLQKGEVKIFGWAKYRYFELFIALEFLYERYNDEWIIDLAKLVHNQGADYASMTDRWRKPQNQWAFDTHIVNIAMMLKYEAVCHKLLGDEYTNIAEDLYKELNKYNGTAVDTFTGDECLSGLSPIQGTELCAVVELMYSYELLYAITGDPVWAERLEVVAFNALPAACSDDMWTHQYDQMVNQINCIRFPGKSIFRTNDNEAHIFGLEPNYGCCTANFGQGWPKLVLSSYIQKGSTIINAVPIPTKLETTVDNVPVKINLVTEYPFRNSFTYEVEAETSVQMELKIRIPSFATNIFVGGKPIESTQYILFDKVWVGKTNITIEYKTTPLIKKRPNNLYSMRAGSLVFALPIEFEQVMHEYTKNDVERKFPYCDYELVGKSEWQFGLACKSFTVEERDGDSIPFSSKNPRLVAKMKLEPIEWGYEDGYNTVCAKIPESREALSSPVEKELYPYGCAKLRITEFPFTM